MSTELSVIVPSLNEGAMLRRTVEQLQATLPADSEIVVVDDGSSDGSSDFLAEAPPGIRLFKVARLGAVGARNFGATQARGRFLLFADAHLELSEGWWTPLVQALESPGVGAVAPAISAIGNPHARGFGMRWSGPELGIEWLPQRGRSAYPVPLLPGCFVAMRRETFAAVGGFDAGMRVWGSEDSELSLRLWLLGYEQRLVPEVDVAHLFRTTHPYTVDWKPVLHNMLRLALLHFSRERVARVIEALKKYHAFAAALALVLESGVEAERARLFSERVRDDDWFFNGFGMDVV